ncbi:hypothetical protein [Halorhodospira halophila]|uniref:hypothetical protein n=1 Tax=Halorhodospira halophila TaxID=1053 RepID=UPI001912E874|nr:hypothetical protein [Halorhodospira halophila]MBK5937163.1 hypothetical protein [Halorhodospira halophila]
MNTKIEYPCFFTLYAAVEHHTVLVPGLWDSIPLWPQVELSSRLRARVVPDARAAAIGLRLEMTDLVHVEANGHAVRASAWQRYAVMPRSALAVLAVELPECRV